jgi:hypothetical protein
VEQQWFVAIDEELVEVKPPGAISGMQVEKRKMRSPTSETLVCMAIPLPSESVSPCHMGA